MNVIEIVFVHFLFFVLFLFLFLVFGLVFFISICIVIIVLFCFHFHVFLFLFGCFRQERALLLFLRYASRWGNQTMRGFIKVGVNEPARHCAPYICPCQFIEQHLKCKPQGKCKYFRFNYWCFASEYYD